MSPPTRDQLPEHPLHDGSSDRLCNADAGSNGGGLQLAHNPLLRTTVPLERHEVDLTSLPPPAQPAPRPPAKRLSPSVHTVLAVALLGGALAAPRHHPLSLRPVVDWLTEIRIHEPRPEVPRKGVYRTPVLTAASDRPEVTSRAISEPSNQEAPHEEPLKIPRAALVPSALVVLTTAPPSLAMPSLYRALPIERSAQAVPQEVHAETPAEPKGLYLQLAAVPDARDAGSLIATLEKNGYAVELQRTEVKGKWYVRVLLKVEDRTAGQKLGEKLVREKLVVTTPMLRKF
jgi:hypothetical protein